MSNHRLEIRGTQGDRFSGKLMFIYKGHGGMKHFAQLTPDQMRELGKRLFDMADHMEDKLSTTRSWSIDVAEGYST